MQRPVKMYCDIYLENAFEVSKEVQSVVIDLFMHSPKNKQLAKEKLCKQISSL